MKHTVCDRCGNEFKDVYENIVLKDSMPKGGNITKFTVKLSIHASKQVITNKGSENASADICSTCAIKLIMKDVMNNLDYS